jgi:hypothetical protein
MRKETVVAKFEVIWRQLLGYTDESGGIPAENRTGNVLNASQKPLAWFEDTGEPHTPSVGYVEAP